MAVHLPTLPKYEKIDRIELEERSDGVNDWHSLSATDEKAALQENR